MGEKRTYQHYRMSVVCNIHLKSNIGFLQGGELVSD